MIYQIILEIYIIKRIDDGDSNLWVQTVVRTKLKNSQNMLSVFLYSSNSVIDGVSKSMDSRMLN